MELVKLSRNKETNRLHAIVKDGELEVVVDETLHGYSFVTNGQVMTSEQAVHIGRAMDDIKRTLATPDLGLTEPSKSVE